MKQTPLLLVLLAAACAEPSALELSIAPLQSGGEAPGLNMDMPVNSVWVTPGEIGGLVADADQAASTLRVTLSSNFDGVVYDGNADGDGRWAWRGELALGEHPILVEVEDREGNLADWTSLLRVRTNQVPTCRIVSPADGTTVRARTDIRFAARVADADGDPLDVLWRSSLDGPLVNGAEFVRRLVTPGRHEISIEVSDQLGEPCVYSVRVDVE